jgi:hypothetical protein
LFPFAVVVSAVGVKHLEAFIAWANSGDDESADDYGEETLTSMPLDGKENLSLQKPIAQKHHHKITKTPMQKNPNITVRNFSKKLSFAIKLRDEFTCLACGRKPPEITLNVDHINPWAKSGKTTFENGQTLCRDCNIGKSDKFNPDLRKNKQSWEEFWDCNQLRDDLSLVEINELKQTAKRA